MNAKRIKRILLEEPQDEINKEQLLSTGSTLLNLACSDRISGGLAKGIYHNLVGDSDTGKSVLGMTILAEASINPEFDNYQLIYNNAERARLLSLDHFPKQLSKRIQFTESTSPEEFYYDLDDRIQNGPVVYILDSMDSLIPEVEEKRFTKGKTAFRKGEEISGSYGYKAKINAANLNRACSKIKATNSILVIISQTHDSFNVLFGPRKTRSGGHALKFYNRWEVWLSVRRTIDTNYKGKKIQIGTKVKCKVQKNHISGKKRTVEISIYNDYGIDDIGDCIDYLIDLKHWNCNRQKITAPEFQFTGSRKDLIEQIEHNKTNYRKLRRITGKVWNEVEKTIALNRKPKYEAY